MICGRVPLETSAEAMRTRPDEFAAAESIVITQLNCGFLGAEVQELFRSRTIPRTTGFGLLSWSPAREVTPQEPAAALEAVTKVNPENQCCTANTAGVGRRTDSRRSAAWPVYWCPVHDQGTRAASQGSALRHGFPARPWRRSECRHGIDGTFSPRWSRAYWYHSDVRFGYNSTTETKAFEPEHNPMGPRKERGRFLRWLRCCGRGRDPADRSRQ
jgi:hypothetical protein